MKLNSPYVIACALVLGSLLVSHVLAQSPAGDVAKLAFEVASIKPNKSGEINSRITAERGGRMTTTNAPLSSIIRQAYQVQSFQLVGGPDWLDSDRFDILAKAEGDPDPEQLRLMVRSLLEERFSLVVHRETKEVPVYGLILARPDGKPGPRLLASNVDCDALMRARTPPPPPLPATTASQNRPMPVCSTRIGRGTLAARSLTMVRFAAGLGSMVDRAVLDKTGLAGSFDIDLEWTADPTADTAGPSIFTALQEQLGLKLESTRGPVEVLVIDRVEQPTPD